MEFAVQQRMFTTSVSMIVGLILITCARLFADPLGRAREADGEHGVA